MAFNDDMIVDETIKKLPSGQYQVSAAPVAVTAIRATPEEISQYNRENPPTPYSGGAEAARALIGQGLGMGFGDEAEAAIRSAFSDEDYKTIRDRLRAQQSQFGQDYPVTQTGLELAGGLALPLGAVGMGVKGLMTGTSALGTLGRGAAAGGVAGGVTGFGTAKEMADVPMDVASGTILGAGIGGLAPSAINLTGRAFRSVADSLGLTNANKFATRKLAQKLEQDNLTAQDAQDIKAEGEQEIEKIEQEIKDQDSADYFMIWY